MMLPSGGAREPAAAGGEWLGSSIQNTAPVFGKFSVFAVFFDLLRAFFAVFRYTLP